MPRAPSILIAFLIGLIVDFLIGFAVSAVYSTMIGALAAGAVYASICVPKRRPLEPTPGDSQHVA